MSRARPSYASSRRQRAALRHASRLRRTSIIAIALGGLLGVTTGIVHARVDGTRWAGTADRAAAEQRWAGQPAVAACTIATQQHRLTARGSATSSILAGGKDAKCKRRAADRPTSTTTAPPTTSPETAAPPTTAPPTTAAPTTAPPTAPPTSAPTTCAPIRITAGGTYSGCYASTSTGTPAVTLATSQPVTLDHARVIAKGTGVQDTVTGTRLKVVDATFEQSNPGAVVAHRAIELRQPASFVAEHNRFTDGDGIWIGGGTVNPLTVRYNLATNIGRYPHPTSPNCCVQFLQLDSVTTPAGEIAWNHTRNTSGQSGVEDNINLFQSGGSDSAHRIDIHHNLIDGAYPSSPSNTTFTGGGILGSDGTGSFGHTNVHDNTVVSTTNYGVGAAGGTDVHLSNNVTVNDALGSDSSTHYYSEFGQAISIHTLTASDATNNKYNWRRDSTASQWPCWMGSFCSGSTQVSTTEQQARDAWTASVPASAQPIGPTA
jgi:hypothetical protein